MYCILKHFFCFFVLIFITASSYAHNPNDQKEKNITFTENKNQWDPQIIYRAQLDGGALFLEKNCFIYNFYDKEKLRKLHAFSGNNESSKKEDLSPTIRSHAYKMTFTNANPANVVTTKSINPSSDYTNYYIGNDPSKWASNVKSYQQINYKNLYPHIDLEVIGHENSIKYNFIVASGGNTDLIAMDYKGLDSIALHEGTLQIKTSLNEITEQRPYAYQRIKGEKIIVPCKFSLKEKQVSFVFEKGYDHGYPLVIDPTLIFASYSGSYADNFGMTATYDSHGNLYSGGTAFDQGFPTTLGAYDPSFNGQTSYGRTDVVLTKYDSTGSSLLYSTYFGGALGSEIVTSLIVNNQDEIFLYGATGSPTNDFPTTVNAYDRTFNGGVILRFIRNGTFFDQGTDIFVAKFNASGTTLLASTYYGGSDNDGVNHNNVKKFSGFYEVINNQYVPVMEYPIDSLQYNYGDQYRGEIMLDPQGNCYIASSTRSSDIPIVNGFDNTLGGKQDAIVLKFNSNLSQLLWSTYLGGDDNDAGYSLAVDDSSIVYVTGGTRSTNFPTTPGALHQSYLGGKTDGYITKINKSGSAIISSTFIGTNGYDQSYFLQLDKRKNVYVVGQTEGVFPVSPGVYSNANGGQFIAKLNNPLSSMIYSTAFGNGTGVDISPAAFLVDYCENVYVSGWGGNIITQVPIYNMPLTANAIQKTTDGFNFYLFVVSKNAQSLIYATYFGGPLSQEHVDGGTSRFDKKGVIYQSVCAGCGRHSDFPTTPGAWSNTNNSNNCNNGTFKMDFGLRIASANFVSIQEGCSPLTVQFEKTSAPGTSYLWDFGNKDTTSSTINPVRTYVNPGQYIAQLIVVDSLSCNIADTTFKYITVYPGIQNQHTIGKINCADSCTGSVSVIANGGTPPLSYLWNTGQNGSSLNALCAGNYDLKISDVKGCIDTVLAIVAAPPPITSVISRINPECGAAICNAGAWASVSGGNAPYQFLWNDPLSQTNDTAVNLCNGTFKVAIADSKGCKNNNTVTINYSGGFPSINASTDKDTVYAGESTSLHVTSAYKYTFQWSPGSTLNTTTGTDPIASPKSTTTYKVTVQDSLGCASIDSVTIYVKNILCTDPEVFIPNGFSPNDDGKNDILYVRGKTIEEMYLAVYDRWGEKIFESTSQQSGWDGRFKGEKVIPAVYAYYLKVRCVNKQEYFKKGNITVIR